MRDHAGIRQLRRWGGSLLLSLLMTTAARAEEDGAQVQCLSKEHVSRLLGATERLALPLATDARRYYKQGPAQASVQVDVELYRARLPRDAFPIPQMPLKGNSARCLTATLAGSGKKDAPGGVKWKTCSSPGVSGPKRPHYGVVAQILVDCENRATAFVFWRPVLVRPGDNEAILTHYDVWLLVADDGARFGEVLSGCLPGGSKSLDSRVGVKQGVERIGEMCFPYHMPAPNGMVYPWQGLKSFEQRQQEIELLGGDK